MKPELWALVGVVIGALLGGLAQIVADLLRRNHEHVAVTRAARRGAYTDWIRGLHDLDGVLAGAFLAVLNEFDSLRAAAEPIESVRKALWAVAKVTTARLIRPMPDAAFMPHADRISEVCTRLAADQATLRLVAPDDTYVAGLAARDALMELVDQCFRDDDDQDVSSSTDEWAAPVDEAVFDQKRGEFYPKRDEFVRLAKRDLGID